MPRKTLRKAASFGAPDRRGHRRTDGRTLPTAGASLPDAIHLMSTPSPVVVHDPRVEDQRFRTYGRYPSYSEPEAVTECALQLRKMGDKLNLRQRILNLIAKLFCPGTQECLE